MAILGKSKRLIFFRGYQKKFILGFLNNLHINNQTAADILKVSVRTFSDWKREKYSLPVEAAQKITASCKIRPQKVKGTVDLYSHLKLNAQKGGQEMYRIHGRVGGDPKKRRAGWEKWWNEIGKNMKISPIGKKKLIYKPRVSESLAEFCGIMLGDGGISQSFIHITLHRTDDLEYIDFVLNLIKKLFRTDPFIYDQKKYSIKRIVLNRKELVAFLTETLGLPLGNKLAHPSPLPEWINRSDKFSRACLRGLIDTDGSVFTHRYKSKGKVYRYYKINFSNKSPALIKFVWHKLRKQGIKSRINKTGTEVCIDAQSDVILYYKTIGFHNPKHLKKLKNYIIVS